MPSETKKPSQKSKKKLPRASKTYSIFGRTFIEGQELSKKDQELFEATGCKFIT